MRSPGLASPVPVDRVFFAVAFLGADRFATDRFAAAIFGAAFLAVVLFAVAFLAVVFFAVAFLAVVFFAVVFFAVVFFAVVFFAVAFFAAVFLLAGRLAVAFFAGTVHLLGTSSTASDYTLQAVPGKWSHRRSLHGPPGVPTGSSGWRVGPLTTPPWLSYRLPWQGQSHVFARWFHPTVHPRCLHFGESVTSSPDSSR